MKMMRMAGIRVAAFLALPALLIFAGCASNSVNEFTFGMAQDEEGNTVIQESSLINNPKLARGLQAGRPTVSFAGDMMQVQIPLTSLYDDTQSYKYQFSWFDANGVQIDGGSAPWLPLVVYGHQTKTVQGVVPRASVTSGKFTLRTD